MKLAHMKSLAAAAAATAALAAAADHGPNRRVDLPSPPSLDTANEAPKWPLAFEMPSFSDDTPFILGENRTVVAKLTNRSESPLNLSAPTVSCDVVHCALERTWLDPGKSTTIYVLCSSTFAGEAQYEVDLPFQEISGKGHGSFPIRFDLAWRPALRLQPEVLEVELRDGLLDLEFRCPLLSELPATAVASLSADSFPNPVLWAGDSSPSSKAAASADSMTISLSGIGDVSGSAVGTVVARAGDLIGKAEFVAHSSCHDSLSFQSAIVGQRNELSFEFPFAVDGLKLSIYSLDG